MHELKGRISNIKLRAQEDRLRRNSVQNFRQPCPLATIGNGQDHQVFEGVYPGGLRSVPIVPSDNPSPPLSDGGELVFDPQLGYTTVSPQRQYSKLIRGPVSFSHARVLSFGDDHSTDENSITSDSYDSSDLSSRTMTEISEDIEGGSISGNVSEEPASSRHEDREDAFDYGNFFLHSSMGTFGRPRGLSSASTDSERTAKGPMSSDQTPSTPETPETLREIERNIHSRAMSIESMESTMSFATAQEGVRSGRQTPSSMAEWLLPRSNDGRAQSRGDDRADSGVGVTDQKTSDGPRMPRAQSRSTMHALRPFLPSIPASPAPSAVPAQLDAHDLGLEDRALVSTLVESVNQICEKLRRHGDSGDAAFVLRRRLDDARRILDGGPVAV